MHVKQQQLHNTTTRINTSILKRLTICPPEEAFAHSRVTASARTNSAVSRHRHHTSVIVAITSRPSSHHGHHGLAVATRSANRPPHHRSSPAHLFAVPLGVSLGRVLRGEATLRAHLAATRAACVGRCWVARLSFPLLPRVKNELQPDADCDDYELVEHVEHRQRDCDLRLSARRTGQA